MVEGREGMRNGGEREEGGRRRGTWSPEGLGSGSELVRFLARRGRRRAGGRWRRTAVAGGVEGAPWLGRSGEGDGATERRGRRGDGAARATGRRSGEGDGWEDEARRTAAVETLGGRSLASGVGLGLGWGWRGREVEGDLAREREIARGKLTNGAPDLGAPLEIFF